MIFKFDLMWKDTKTASVVLDSVEKSAKITNFEEDYFENPLVYARSFEDVMEFLEDRRVDLGRKRRHLAFKDLSVSGDLFLEMQDSRGVDVDDFIWVRFEDDNVSWDQINPRVKRKLDV